MFLNKTSNWGVNLGAFVSQVSEVCELFVVPSRSSNTPFYLSKHCELRSVLQLFTLTLFFCLGLTFESFKELRVRHSET